MPRPMRFEAIALPAAKEPAYTEVVSTRGVVVAGARHDIAWQPLLRPGQDVAGTAFGALVDEQGQPLATDPWCAHPDAGALVQAHGSVWHLGHLECMPGAIWKTRLGPGADGRLVPEWTAPVDLSAVHGGKHFCAGQVTPWQSLLSGEEYDVDARRVAADGSLVEGYAYEDYDPVRMAAYHVDPPRLPYAYDHGWVDETRIVDAEGTTEVVKHFAMGRFSHEQAYLMPDRRTVYLSDDGTNGALFLFVADRADDLSTGTLYAARFTQTRADGGGQGTLAWISLGHATDAHIQRSLASGGVVFSDLFRSATIVGSECPAGFTPILDSWGAQCLAPVEGSDPVLASRVEARRSAAIKGATTELRKAEGMTWDPDHSVLYLAIAEVNKGMAAGSPDWDLPEIDHVRFEENRCGGVYALSMADGQVDDTGTAIPSPYVATRLTGFVMGRQQGFGCAADAPANPDNLAYLPGTGQLLMAEDSSHHRNNLLWAIDVHTLHHDGMAALTPILAAPPGGEVTGLQWFPDVGGQGWLTTTVQHPWQGTPEETSRSAEERRGAFGLLGPFPVP